MHAMGGQRSGASMAHHQRQYPDNFVETSSNGRWLQSAGFHHLQSSNNPVPELQDFGFCNVRGQGSKLYRSVQGQKAYDARIDFFAEPLTAPDNLWHRNKGEETSPNENSPGLLDLHSLDTELLDEMSIQGIYDGRSAAHFSQGARFEFDDPETYIGMNKQAVKAYRLPESNVSRRLTADNVKANSVAKIKVVVRKRPINKKELAKNEKDVIETFSNSVVVHETKVKVDLTEYLERHEFVFDAVLNEEVSNEEVYQETVEPIIPILFQRTKATCFAYGQTGSGKTYTMQPLPLKAVKDILRHAQCTYRNQGFQLFVSFFEIYGGKLYDLLSDRKKLCMREDGKQQVCIVGLQEYRVSDVETVAEHIERGNATRSTGTTGANEESSRSHAILQLTVKRSADGSESKPARVVGKLSFIDLAGSERGADTTDNDKQTRMEGAEINKSLLALKECIRALDNDQGHIPFRGSKLTEVLRDSFVGNSRTVMISCISPNAGSCEHTLNTLRYADRVKSLSRSNNSKKDVLSSISNLKESMVQPLSAIMPPEPIIEDDIYDPWSEKIGKQEYEEGWYNPEIPPWMPSKFEPHNATATDVKTKLANGLAKWKEPPKSKIKYSNSDYDLKALLKEEEDLIEAHRRQVEETMDIVKEEMNLLVEADKPGNQLDDYISRLNTILSHKAAGILELQNLLALFQKRLKEQNVLVY